MSQLTTRGANVGGMNYNGNETGNENEQNKSLNKQQQLLMLRCLWSEAPPQRAQCEYGSGCGFERKKNGKWQMAEKES